MSFVSSKGNILCRLIKIELYKIFAIINRAIKGLHCNDDNEKMHPHFTSQFCVPMRCMQTLNDNHVAFWGIHDVYIQLKCFGGRDIWRMRWLPNHKQPWYWLCRSLTMNRSLASIGFQLPMPSQCGKMKYIIHVSSEQFRVKLDRVVIFAMNQGLVLKVNPSGHETEIIRAN